MWKRIRYRMEWLGLSFGAWMVPLLPRGFWLGLAQILGRVIFAFDAHGRKVALANLELALGDSLIADERVNVARESYQHFARSMIDLLWSPRLNKQNAPDFVEFENWEETERAGGSFILGTYHYSNFEWLSQAFGYAGITGVIVSQEFKNSLLDDIFKKIRERCGHEFVPREGGIIRLYKAVRRGATTALLVDLTVPPTQGAVPIECFGLKTSVTGAHAWLHQRTGRPIIPAHCEPLPGGRYRVVLHPLIRATPEMTTQQIAQACWNAFEPHLRKNPAPWLWAYKHWRYRPVDAARPYPFYSHIYEAFDELLQEQPVAPGGEQGV